MPLFGRPMVHVLYSETGYSPKRKQYKFLDDPRRLHLYSYSC